MHITCQNWWKLHCYCFLLDFGAALQGLYDELRTLGTDLVSLQTFNVCGYKSERRSGQKATV